MNMPIYFIYIYFFSNKTKQNEFDFTTICYVCRLTVTLSPGPMVLRILEERGGSPPTAPVPLRLLPVSCNIHTTLSG